MSEVDVFSPTRHNWVRLYACVAVLFKEREECFPHFGEAEFFGGGWVAKESIATTFI
jgi:hypothetical protein